MRGRAPEAEKAFRAPWRWIPRRRRRAWRWQITSWRSAGGPEAEASLKEALAIDPKNNLANRGLAALYLRHEPGARGRAVPEDTGRGGHVAAGDLQDRPGRVLRADRPPGGCAEDSRAARRGEGVLRALAELAAIQDMQKEPTLAHQTIDEVLQREPKNEEALLIKAKFLLAERKRTKR